MPQDWAAIATEFKRYVQRLPDRLLDHLRLLDGDWSSSTISVAGYRAKDGEDMEPWRNVVGPGYFATMGIPMAAGREFAPSDERTMILEDIDWTRPDAQEKRDRAEALVTGSPKYAMRSCVNSLARLGMAPPGHRCALLLPPAETS